MIEFQAAQSTRGDTRMGWQRRGRRSYFYFAVKRGGKVAHHYLGPVDSPVAQLTAQTIENRRTEAAAERAQRREWQEALKSVKTFATLVSRLVHATLLAHGYHRPGRHAWRKKKHV